MQNLETEEAEAAPGLVRIPAVYNKYCRQILVSIIHVLNVDMFVCVYIANIDAPERFTC